MSHAYLISFFLNHLPPLAYQQAQLSLCVRLCRLGSWIMVHALAGRSLANQQGFTT